MRANGGKALKDCRASCDRYTTQLEERIRQLEEALVQQPQRHHSSPSPPLRRTALEAPGVGPLHASPHAAAPSFAGTPPPYNGAYASTGTVEYGAAVSMPGIVTGLPAPVPTPPAPPAPTSFLPPAFVPTVAFASSSEALERQPRNASGYEWNERANSSKPNQDGTASLSLEPDGQGYLGFASGATLLRILQIIAGISHIDVPAAGSASDSVGWQPTDAEMTACVDAYFTYYHVEYPLIHEATFRAQWNEVICPPDGPGWELLTNVVLALGAFVSFRPMEAVDYFLERALAKVNVDCLEGGNLTLVQAFTLLSNITQKRNKPNAGSIYLGIATRMATSLGLHRELPSWQITPHEREVRSVPFALRSAHCRAAPPLTRFLAMDISAGAASGGRCSVSMPERASPLADLSWVPRDRISRQKYPTDADRANATQLLPAGEADVQMVHNVSDRVSALVVRDHASPCCCC